MRKSSHRDIQYQLDLIYIVKCVFDNFRICKAVFKNCPTSKIPSKDLQFSEKISPKATPPSSPSRTAVSTAKVSVCTASRHSPARPPKSWGKNGKFAGKRCVCKYPLRERSHTPPNGKRRIIFKTDFSGNMYEYVSFQEGIQSYRGV